MSRQDFGRTGEDRDGRGLSFPVDVRGATQRHVLGLKVHGVGAVAKPGETLAKFVSARRGADGNGARFTN